MDLRQILNQFWHGFRFLICRSPNAAQPQPQRTIKNCQKPLEISTTKLQNDYLPFCRTPAAAINVRTKTPISKVRGRRCSRRMAHSDPPPPSGGRTACQTKLRILQISEFSDSKSLCGPTLRRRPLPQKSCKGPLDRLRPPFC